MAIPFIAIRNARRTMIAADVFWIKPESTSSDQRKICIGYNLDGARMPAGGVATNARIAIISSGEVWPSASAMPIIVQGINN